MQKKIPFSWVIPFIKNNLQKCGRLFPARLRLIQVGLSLQALVLDKIRAPFCKLFLINGIILNCLQLVLLSSCYKNHLYVQQEWLNEKYLASTRVHTPDPRQANPPKGQKLLVKWDFPKSQFDRQLTLLITVRLWDHSEQIFTRLIERKRDFIDLRFQDSPILTYKVEVLTKDKEVLEVWKHHFWTELIDVRADSPRKRSSSVSSQLRQGSVMETP